MITDSDGTKYQYVNLITLQLLVMKMKSHRIMIMDWLIVDPIMDYQEKKFFSVKLMLMKS